jgi:hypothetical protein
VVDRDDHLAVDMPGGLEFDRGTGLLDGKRRGARNMQAADGTFMA